MYTLRDIKQDDYVELFHCGNDEEAKKFYDPTVFKSLDSLKEYFDNYFLNLKQLTGMPTQIIVLDNTIIGFIYFCYVKKEGNKKMGELSFLLHKSYRGKGIMTNVLKDVVERGFNELGLDLILVSCYPSNKGTVQLTNKLKMSFIETWYAESDIEKNKPVNLYGLTKENYCNLWN